MSSMTRDEKRFALRHAIRYWPLLRKCEQDDLIDGKCTFSEYHGVPILDYTKPHPIFSHAD